MKDHKQKTLSKEQRFANALLEKIVRLKAARNRFLN